MRRLSATLVALAWATAVPLAAAQDKATAPREPAKQQETRPAAKADAKATTAVAATTTATTAARSTTTDTRAAASPATSKSYEGCHSASKSMAAADL